MKENSELAYEVPEAKSRILIPVSFSEMIKYLWQLTLPEFWIVAIFPVYIGYILASKNIFPTVESFLALIIMGPLIMGSTLMLNEYFDRDIDRKNPRKANSPLIKGLIEPGNALEAAIALMLIGSLTSFAISIPFTVVVVSCILLSLFYSAPPLRFKSLPGADMIVNAVGLGVLCPLAGYLTVSNPQESFPLLYLIISTTGLGAAYISTTMVDYDVDRECGINSISVKIGKRNAYLLGLAFIAIANFGVIFMGLYNMPPFAPRIVGKIWPLCVLTVVFYAWLVRRVTRRTFWVNFAMIAIAVGVENVMWVLWYTGYWLT
jgi:chlorophyll synthase